MLTVTTLILIRFG